MSDEAFRLLRAFIVAAVLASLVAPALGAAATELRPQAEHSPALKPNEVHDYSVALRRGESAVVVVNQKGIDVVVEIRSPGGALLDEVDGPTGREGEEVAEIVAQEGGTYALRVRPFTPSGPAGTYAIQLRERRTVDATRAILRQREAARAEATAWLRSRTSRVAEPRAELAALAARATVIGLGEATHGSREFGDLRLELTRRLITHHGYRIVALEQSADSIAAQRPYIAGESSSRTVAASGWIGRRWLLDLVEWVRDWNVAHPADRVRIVGLDPQENQRSLRTLSGFLEQAYDDDTLLAAWAKAQAEVAAADAQTSVFGNSSVDPEARQFLFELLARLTLDEAMLRREHGAAVEPALAAATTLAEMADFNSGAPLGRSRDWYMAMRVLRALGESPGSRAVYWAHNAHVAARGGTAGGVLRASIGCAYAPIALTFFEGSFIAQVANDPGHRLERFTLQRPAEQTIETMLSPLSEGPVLSIWPCGKEERESVPPWLLAPRPMRWIGGIWSSEYASSAQYRAFDLLDNFDGILFLPRVTAEEIPADLEAVPPRHP